MVINEIIMWWHCDYITQLLPVTGPLLHFHDLKLHHERMLEVTFVIKNKKQLLNQGTVKLIFTKTHPIHKYLSG